MYPPTSPRRNSRHGREWSRSPSDSSHSSDSYDSYSSFSRSPSPRSRRQRRFLRHRSVTPPRRRHSRSPSVSRSRSRSRSPSRSSSPHPRYRVSLRSRSPSRSISSSHSRSQSRSYSRSYSSDSSRSHSPRGVRRLPSYSSRARRRVGYRSRSLSRSKSPPLRARRSRRTPSPDVRRYSPRYRGREYVRRPRRPWRLGGGGGGSGGGLWARERGLKRKLSPLSSRLMPTVFVTQLAQRVRQSDVFDLFARAGRVRDIRLVMDRHTGRHKGAAYVEFYDRNALTAAIRLSGSMLCGFPVEVRAWDDGGRDDWRGARHEPEPVLDKEAAMKGSNTAVGWSSRPPMRYVDGGTEITQEDRQGGEVDTNVAPATNLTPQLVTIEELKVLLNPRNLPTTSYGSGTIPNTPITSVVAKSEGTPNPALNGVKRVPLPVAAGAEAPTRVYVGGLPEGTTSSDLQSLFSEFGDVIWCDMEQAANGSSNGVGVIEFANSASADRALGFKGRNLQERAVRVCLRRNDLAAKPDVSGEIDDGGEGSVGLNASRRLMLMQQLSRGEPVNGRRMRGDLEKLKLREEPSVSIMLSNMFNPATEKDGFEQGVAEEVRDECATYGKVVHVHVEKASHGVVYVRFDKVNDAVKAKAALDGRWFDGNKIVVGFVSDEEYLQRFTSAMSSTVT